jgi:eukaryotic-like serine/threonine-protein kinase
MTEPARCSACGLALDPPGPGGLCAACLLEMALQATAGKTGAEAADVPGDIGPYHLLQALGEGGMGLVYLAEQREPISRRVALKLIKPGMDTRDVLARFEAERQALALMDHPYIARVIDAGLGPRNRPYFVMEYVAGVPITEYCDLQRLPNADRLRIFAQVCAALQHAHQKGVIHRDLKPSNILVAVQDGKPVPKVIDFGIAKATRWGSAERSVFTQLGVLIGTPEYSSPEQVEASGLDVDTTTDIYSLGVVLYELLTGVLPFDGQTLRRAGYREMHRVIREQDPPRPSARVTAMGATATDAARQRRTTPPGLGKQLRGDLDAIAMKAMEKDRTRRYASASEFAADIGRYLNGETVAARPPRAIYRIRKFVRRHRAGVTAAGVIAASLVAGLVTSTIFYLRAERARADAEDQAYSATISAADLLTAADQPGEARSRLSEAPRRGWEWWYLFHKTDTSVETLFPSGGFGRYPIRLSSFAFSGDGSRVLWNAETTIHAWDAQTFAPVAVYGGFGTVLALGPTGALAITSGAAPSSDHAVRVIDPASGRLVASLNGHASGVACAAISSDPPLAATSDGRTVRTWGATSGRSLAAITGGCPVAFSDDRRWVVSANEQGAAQVTDAATGRHLVTLGANGERVSTAAFGHKGTILATDSVDGTIRVWTLPSGALCATMRGHAPAPHSVTALAFSPDDVRLASAAGDQTARLWDVASGGEIARFADFVLRAISVAFEPNGRRLMVAGSPHSRGAEIRIYDTDAVNPWRTLAHTTSVESLAFSPDGRQIASGTGDGTIVLWDASNLERASVLSDHTGPVTAVAYHPSASLMASGSKDDTVRLWDTGTGRLRGTFEGHRQGVTAVTFSPRGTEIASSSGDGLVLVRDSLAGTVLARWQEKVPVSTVRFDRTGTYLAIGSGKSRIVPSGGGVRLWDWRAGKVGATANLARASAVHSIAISPADGRVVFGGTGETNAAVWDPTLTRGVGTLHLSYPSSVFAFSPDGSRLVSASGDGLVRVVDGRSLRSLLTLAIPAGTSPPAIAFSPDGRRIAVALAKGIRLWESTSAYHPDANSLVARLYKELVLADAVASRLRRDESLDPKLREAALRVVRAHGDDPYALSADAWAVVRAPGGSPAAYALARRRAERAAAVAPWDATVLRTQAFARLRTGACRDAIASEESRSVLPGRPTAPDLALVAMARFRLGEHGPARDALEMLRAAMKEPDNASDGEFVGLLREAEALVQGRK